MTKTMPWAATDAARPVSAALLYLLAAILQTGSHMLTRLAVRVSESRAAVPPQTVEFHALYGDAGAPEGALYVNGELVGWIEGVKRL
ncbi:MAG: hypothetical protein ACAH21_00070 [Ramlibacter sp.]